MIQRWVIGCTHFDDEAVARSRGYSSAAEMALVIELRWKILVSPQDIVYILGDFALKRTVYWATRLPGRKILVLGNHDKELCYTGIFLTVTQRVLLHLPPKSPNELPLDVFMDHYPCNSWERRHKGTVHLHAHSHGSLGVKPLKDTPRVDMSVDCWTSWPVPLSTAIALAQ